MDIRPFPFDNVKSLARQPFRALNALVEFFAPWQKEGLEYSDTAGQAHTLEAAHQLRHCVRSGQIVTTAQLVTGFPKHLSMPAVLRAGLRNTAVAAANQAPSSSAPTQSQAVWPVRVIRDTDAQIPPTASGRMVISGRMADVCAELERLSDAAQA